MQINLIHFQVYATSETQFTFKFDSQWNMIHFSVCWPVKRGSLSGAIQLKNWKPLTFDVITDDKSATIDDILRELKEYTLRIRLSR